MRTRKKKINISFHSSLRCNERRSSRTENLTDGLMGSGSDLAGHDKRTAYNSIKQKQQ